MLGDNIKKAQKKRERWAHTKRAGGNKKPPKKIKNAKKNKKKK